MGTIRDLTKPIEGVIPVLNLVRRTERPSFRLQETSDLVALARHHPVIGHFHHFSVLCDENLERSAYPTAGVRFKAAA